MIVFRDKIIVMDIETTDSTLGPPEIVEIAGVRMSHDLTLLEEFSTLVRPSDISKFSEYCETFTGITRADLRNAPTWNEVWPKWMEHTHYNHGILAGWAVGSDVNILENTYKNYSLGYPHAGRTLDLLSMTYYACSWLGVKVRSWSLCDVCERFEVEQLTQHRALADAMSAARLIQAIAAKTDELTGD